MFIPSSTFPTPPIAPPKTHPTPALFWWLVISLMGLALIPTLWTELDFAAAAWARDTGAVEWWWIRLINAYVPLVFRITMVGMLLVWMVLRLTQRGKRWHMTLAFVVLTGAFGPGVVVNEVFKEHWHRARPYQVQEFGGEQQFSRAGIITDQCYNNCSFVSGHTACGFFLASLLLIETTTRRRRLWAAAGMVAGGLVGFARMVDTAHWLSDVLWAGPITLLSSWVAWKIILRWYPPTAK